MLHLPEKNVNVQCHYIVLLERRRAQSEPLFRNLEKEDKERHPIQSFWLASCCCDVSDKFFHRVRRSLTCSSSTMADMHSVEEANISLVLGQGSFC